MEIWTGIIIPILSSIIGGLLGGLFTFLGIKITLKNEKIEKNEEKRLRTINENLQIIKNRPILELTNKNSNVKNANVNKPGSLASKANMVNKFNDSKK